MIEIITYKKEDISIAAKKFLKETSPYKKFAFYGNMGSGKTTFIKAICKILGVDENIVNSPTFTIINEYKTFDNNIIIFHCDFYRIKTLDELYNIGFEEYLYNNEHYLFIEWPEIIENILPEDVLKVQIKEIDENKRMIIRKS